MRPVKKLHTIFTDFLIKELNYSENWEEFRESWCSHLSIIDGMLDYLQSLEDKYSIYLLSNTNLLHWEHLLMLSDGDLRRYPAFLSFEMGLSKPDLFMYKSVIESVDIAPSSCLFVDDAKKNVEAAATLGIQVCHYTKCEDIQEMLS